MAKPIAIQAHQAVLEIIARASDPLAIDQIETSLAPRPNRRTLQRWLNQLIKQGQLQRRGQGRAVTYGSSQDSSPAEGIIALSLAARRIEQHVRQPLARRTPVGYNQDFLDRYRPNETSYLSQHIRDELRAQGRAVSSQEPAGTYARQLAHRLLIDLSWNSSRLEGNTYSLLETERLISVGEAASGKNAREAQMILNHKGAIEFLIEFAADIGFNRYTVLNLHALLSDNLLEDPTASGRLRSIAEGIGQTHFCR